MPQDQEPQPTRALPKTEAATPARQPQELQPQELQPQELQPSEGASAIQASRDVAAAVTISIIQFFTAIVERFGWPGAAIFLIFFCIQRWASDDQKREIVDKYILGKGMQAWWLFVMVTLFFLLLAWGQHVIYRKELKLKDAELKRVGREKSATQEQVAGRKWKHVEELEGDR